MNHVDRFGDGLELEATWTASALQLRLKLCSPTGSFLAVSRLRGGADLQNGWVPGPTC